MFFCHKDLYASFACQIPRFFVPAPLYCRIFRRISVPAPLYCRIFVAFSSQRLFNSLWRRWGRVGPIVAAAVQHSTSQRRTCIRPICVALLVSFACCVGLGTPYGVPLARLVSASFARWRSFARLAFCSGVLASAPKVAKRAASSAFCR